MRTEKNLYYKITDIDAIMDMYKMVKKNTKNKRKIENFDNYYITNIVNIKNILETNKYYPGKYHIFLIKEPKLRIIMSQDIIDKTINHLVSKYFLVDMFDKSFIDTAVATRKNKGTYLGLKLTKKYINLMKNKYNNFYYLKFDINKYFYNMDHNVIKNIIKNKIKDDKVVEILNRIIDSTNEKYVNEKIKYIKLKEINKIKNSNICNKDIKIKEVNDIPYYQYDKGFPIGNMSSQIFATLYLDSLNHFIKEILKIKYYILYMDDGILFCENKEYLKYCLKEIDNFLKNLKLTLNQKKTKINHINSGIEFLGFRFIIKNNRIIMKVKNQTKNNFKNKMKFFNNKKCSEKYYQIKASYLGHLSHGNCKRLIFNNIN